MTRKWCFVLFVVALGATWLGCGSGGPTKPPVSTLNLVAAHALGINEPSGLAINDSATSLWAVTNTHVYHLNMSGQVIKRLNYDGVDLEGITYDSSDRTLWVAEEESREVVHLDLHGNLLSRTAIGLTGQPNHGIEGLCINAGQMSVVNEQEPGLLVALKPDHTVESQQTLNFAGDYSDLAASPQADHFWILSDQSRGVFLYNRATRAVVRGYTLPFPKPEGLAVDEGRNRFYVVSDSTETLYIYAAP